MSADEWLCKYNVPVYDAHIVVDKETGLEHRIDKQKLQAIADRMNKRFDETGEESPIVIGHTRDGRPEWEQPPIVGYAHGFYVDEHPGAKRPFLYARNYKIYKESTVGGERLSAEEILKRYPRRSPEVWLNRNEIDPLALLGATTPMRDLGLVRNSRGKNDLVTTERGTMPRAQALKRGLVWPERPVKYSAVAGMDYSAIVMAVEALLQQLKGGLVPEGDAQPELDPGADMDSGNEAVAAETGAAPEKNMADQFGQDEDAEDGDGGDFGGQDEEEQGPPKKKYQMDQAPAAAAASSTNSYLPGDRNVEQKKKKTDESGELERVKMQRDQKAIEVYQFEKRLSALEAENKALKEARDGDRMKYQRQVRTGDLKQLVGEGYTLDVAEEIEEVAAMDEEKYFKYLDRLRKRYSRVPLNEEFIQTARVQEGGARAVSPDIRDKAIEISSRKGIDFASALRMAQTGEA